MKKYFRLITNTRMSLMIWYISREELYNSAPIFCISLWSFINEQLFIDLEPPFQYVKKKSGYVFLVLVDNNFESCSMTLKDQSSSATMCCAGESLFQILVGEYDKLRNHWENMLLCRVTLGGIQFERFL